MEMNVKDNSTIDSILNPSTIKASFDKLISRYTSENYNIDDQELMHNNFQNEELAEQKTNNSKTKHKGQNKSISANKGNLNSDQFIKDNFCNNECVKNFNKILTAMKEGRMDLSKINWNEAVAAGNNNASDYNFFQNLVNFYYNLGYEQGSNQTNNEKQNQSDPNIIKEQHINELKL